MLKSSITQLFVLAFLTSSYYGTSGQIGNIPRDEWTDKNSQRNNQRNPQTQHVNNPTSFNQQSQSHRIPKPQLKRNPTKEVVKALQELTLDFSSYHLANRNTGNSVFSPLSISLLLHVLLLAARGQTYSEIKRAVNYPNDITDEEIHIGFGRLLSGLERPSGIDFKISNRLYVQKGSSVNGIFSTKAEKHYNTNIRGLDFKGKSATNEINDWIKRETKGKIVNFFSSLSPETQLVAANVVYFNGAWKTPFSKRGTQLKDFDTGEGVISVPMMVNIVEARYGSFGKVFDVVALPYVGGRFSLYVMVPQGKAGFASLRLMENKLDSGGAEGFMTELQQLMAPEKVTVSIPRMRLYQKINLKTNLERSGIKQLFTESSDLGRMTSSGVLLNTVLTASVIEVTEEGTEAAAATGASFDRIGSPYTINLNQPSIIAIRDDQTGLILFWAKVLKPEAIHN